MMRWIRFALELVGLRRPRLLPPMSLPRVGLTQSRPPPALSDTQPVPLTRRGSGERPCVRPPKP